MSEKFDDLTRILATPMPRRQAFRLMLGSIAGSSALVRVLGGGLLGSLLSSKRLAAVPAGVPSLPCGALAAGAPCLGGLRCLPPRVNCPGTFDCCDPAHMCCPTAVGTNCCRPGFPFNEICCGPDLAGFSKCCNLAACDCCPIPGFPGSFDCVVPPLIAMSSVTSSQLVMQVQDTSGFGLSAVETVTAINAEVLIPAFSPGTTLLQVIANKINLALPARVAISACIPCGTVAQCRIGDPVLAELRIPRGRRGVRDSFQEIPPEERYVTVQNGTPGVRKVQVFLNGRREAVRWLRDGMTRTVDLGPAMLEENNTVSVVAEGRPGSSVLVVIGDTPGQSAGQSETGALSLVWEQESREGESLHWGR